MTLEGVFNSSATPAPSLTVNSGADLYIDAGDALFAATATFNTSGYVSLTDGTLTVTGNASFGSYLTVTGAGSFTVVGTMTTSNGTISASNSSRVEIGALNGTSGGLSLTANSTSTIEIGNQDVGAAGSITIDSGVSFTESGTFQAPVIVVNGTITVAANAKLELYGTSSRGLTGSGKININSGSNLTVYDVDPGTSDTVTINFAQNGGQLWLPSGDFDALGNFKPAITNYGATDVIEYYGTATSASYSGGFLTLYNGANLVANFNIGSGYTGDTFSLVAICGRLHAGRSGRHAEQRARGHDDIRFLHLGRPGRRLLEYQGQLGRYNRRPEPGCPRARLQGPGHYRRRRQWSGPGRHRQRQRGFADARGRDAARRAVQHRLRRVHGDAVRPGRALFGQRDQCHGRGDVRHLCRGDAQRRRDERHRRLQRRLRRPIHSREWRQPAGGPARRLRFLLIMSMRATR